MLKLWRVKRLDHVGWDEYDAIICVAATEEEALKIKPVDEEGKPAYWIGEYTDEHYVKLEAEVVGKPRKDMKAGFVVLSSYRAG